MVAAGAVTLVAAAALVAGAVHGVRSAAVLSSDSQQAQARLDDEYYACLQTQAHSLVLPGTTVELSTSSPGDWATLAKATASWATLTDDPRRAAAELSLLDVGTRTPGSCLGSVVVARYRGQQGRPGPVRVGTGASLVGGSGPPPTPL